MIEKMQFLSLTGPKEEIDRVAETYLSRYEIQLENALTELSDIPDLKPFLEVNPYREPYTKTQKMVAVLPQESSENEADLLTMSKAEAIDSANRLDEAMAALRASDEDRSKRVQELNETLSTLLPFDALDYDLEKLLQFRSVHCHFGRIPLDYVEKFQTYIEANPDIVFNPVSRDEDYVWGIWFCPASKTADCTAVCKSLHFERCRLGNYSGTPKENIERIRAELEELEKAGAAVEEQQNALLLSRKRELLSANHILARAANDFDIRKKAAITTARSQTSEHFILCGWMSDRDAEQLSRELDEDRVIHCIVYGENSGGFSTPPTKLRNAKIIQPFEMYVKMYGLPNYRELDPTLFVALTYSFIFGWMFGDLGQGLVLMAGGFLLYKLKDINLAAIIGCAGIFSAFFGLMFGSFFGFEDILRPVWLRPMNAMSSLPFLGRLNTVLVVSVAFGMALILVAMILHIINAVRQKDFNGLWLDTNGVAGLVFYLAVVICVVLFMTGHPLPAGIVLAVFFVLPLILIGFKEPIGAFLQKKKAEEESGPVMMVVQALFELIEVLLSYFSNTISFVRIGAFAISHAAMMEVVMMLAGAANGNPNMVVIVLGNAFVIGMEGLVVGIQVLRLEYYEMFSRFYRGDGRAFKPFIEKQS